jgi:hypothetical protein
MLCRPCNAAGRHYRKKDALGAPEWGSIRVEIALVRPAAGGFSAVRVGFTKLPLYPAGPVTSDYIRHE